MKCVFLFIVSLILWYNFKKTFVWLKKRKCIIFFITLVLQTNISWNIGEIHQKGWLHMLCILTDNSNAYNIV